LPYLENALSLNVWQSRHVEQEQFCRMMKQNAIEKE